MDWIDNLEFLEDLVTVGIFWVVGDENNQKIIFDSTEYSKHGKGFINYEWSHFEKWDKLSAEQEGGKYKKYDCYYFPRGRVLYNCDTKKTMVYADQKILNRISELEEELMGIFLLEDFEYCTDEHYQSYAKWDSADKLNYKILRGAEKIGANLLEFSRGGTKILVEFGSELDAEDDGLTKQEKDIIEAVYDACIITHYHGDHAGKIGELNWPIYMGRHCKAIINTISDYTGGKKPKTVRTFRDEVPFIIGSIKITPYLCDHSAADSYMLLFEGGGKKVLYTGDYRSSGRKSFAALLQKLPTNIDVLITEATNLNRITQKFNEIELERQASDIMRLTDKPVFVLQSSTNIDRLVSFYKAARRTNRKFFIDDYQAQICDSIGGKIPRPDIFTDVFTFAPKVLKGERYEKFNNFKNKISRAQIGKQKKYCMLVRSSHLSLIKSLSRQNSLSGSVLVYSMWEGYKEKEDMYKFLKGIEALGIKIVSMHTSGHADSETIERLITHVNPKIVKHIHCQQWNK